MYYIYYAGYPEAVRWSLSTNADMHTQNAHRLMFIHIYIYICIYIYIYLHVKATRRKVRGILTAVKFVGCGDIGLCIYMTIHDMYLFIYVYM